MRKGRITVAMSPTPPLLPLLPGRLWRRTALGATTSTRAGAPLVKASMRSKNVIWVNSGAKRACGAWINT